MFRPLRFLCPSDRRSVWSVLIYVTVVLGVDTLATQGGDWPINWRVFSWYGPEIYQALTWAGLPGPDVLLHPVLSGFNYFRFLAWFLVPFLCCLRGFDWGWLGWKRWRKIDLALLGGIVLVGAVIMGLLPYLPGVRDIYPTYGSRYDSFPWEILQNRLLWVVSWLLGWEFLHRYLLLRAVDRRWKRLGWLLVPLFEGAYHLQKPLIEAFGMVVFSLLLTQWARKRRNLLLPFLAHLIIEIELILYQLLF